MHFYVFSQPYYTILHYILFFCSTWGVIIMYIYLCACVCVCVHHTGVTINVAVGIAVVVTGTIALVVGVLAGVLVYHCISKHRSHLKPELSSHQKQQTDPEYEEVSATSGKEKFELRENIAYEPVQH